MTIPMVWLLLGGFRLQNHCICNIFTYGEQRVANHWIYNGLEVYEHETIVYVTYGEPMVDNHWIYNGLEASGITTIVSTTKPLRT